MPLCEPGYIEDVSGNCVMDVETDEIPFKPTTLPSPEESGDQITCWDGSLQNSVADCPDPQYNWQTPQEWMEGEEWEDLLPAWYDQPGGENEWQTYIYEEIAGGEEKSGYTQQEFFEEFGDLFPTWEESSEFRKFTNVLQQMGLEEKGKETLWEKWVLDKEAESLKAEATMEKYSGQFEALPYAAESQFVLAGGGVSGRNIAKMKAVSQDLSITESLELEGIQMDVDALTSAYQGHLETVEGQQLKLEGQLGDIQQSYTDKLASLYDASTMRDFCDEDGGCPDGEKCSGMGEAGGGVCIADPDYVATTPCDGHTCANGACVDSEEDCSEYNAPSGWEGLGEGVKNDLQEAKDAFIACNSMPGTEASEEAGGPLAACWDTVKETVDVLGITPTEFLDWTVPGWQDQLQEGYDFVEGEFRELAESVLGEGTVETIVETTEAALDSLCVKASATGCTAWAALPKQSGYPWSKGYKDRVEENYQGCLEHWCG